MLKLPYPLTVPMTSQVFTVLNNDVTMLQIVLRGRDTFHRDHTFLIFSLWFVDTESLA